MQRKKYRISILGDGGWGTALAIVNVRRSNDVLLWSAFPDYAETLRKERENKKFLPGIFLSEEIKITSDLKEAVDFGEILILAIPTQYVRNVLFKMKTLGYGRKKIVSVAKGIEKKTLLRPSEIVRSVLGSRQPVVVLSGPSHAEEVARGLPTLIVAASENESEAEAVQKALIDTYFRIYVQTDLVGVELGAACKNVIAIAVGICDGLKFGDNAKAGLISRALLEIMRLGVKMGANPNTFFGLSGLGDLATTCYSSHGRNLRVGRLLGEGKKIEEILKGMQMVAEGVDTSASIYDLTRRLDVSTPIMEEVYKILFKGKEVRQAVTSLLERNAAQEWKYRPL